MEAAMLSPDRIFNSTPLSEAAADYEIVRKAIGHIRGHWREQQKSPVGHPGRAPPRLAERAGQRLRKARFFGRV